MKPLTSAIVVAVSLSACSQHAHQSVKHSSDVATIDKTEIEMARSHEEVGVWCVVNLTKMYANPKSVAGKLVNITDGSKLLATGRIHGLAGVKGGQKIVLSLVFESPDVAEKLISELGFTRHVFYEAGFGSSSSYIYRQR